MARLRPGHVKLVAGWGDRLRRSAWYISGHYRFGKGALPGVSAPGGGGLRRPAAGAGAGAGRGVRYCARADPRGTARRRCRRAGGEPHHPRRPPRRVARRHRCRQARVEREAAGGGAWRGRRSGARRHGRRGAVGLRAGHLPRRRPSDLPQAARRRLDRHPAARGCLHGRPRSRELACRPRLLLPARRRPDVRRGTLLPHLSGTPPGAGAQRHRAHPHHPSRAPDHQRTALRRAHHRRGADPRAGAAAVRRRGPGADPHQLRRAGRQSAGHRDLRQRGVAGGAGSQRAGRSGSPGPRPGVGAGAPEPRPHRNHPRPRGGGPGLCRAPRPHGSVPAGSWRCTCWTSCTPSTKRRRAGRQVELTTTCERPAPLPLGLLHGELD